MSRISKYNEERGTRLWRRQNEKGGEEGKYHNQIKALARPASKNKREEETTKWVCHKRL